ncbi:hypothetical protein NDU88_010516 [Pleurodeles waltl]|uniref:Uncharacterized protein n=1 Tax=Pleurodeles waltl TaxID=8319 RepID=A0AAV7PYA9_PLEWA|nr:hypothetical protein NDU88_010516 [Pleurodeles waltl]
MLQARSLWEFPGAVLYGSGRDVLLGPGPLLQARSPCVFPGAVLYGNGRVLLLGLGSQARSPCVLPGAVLYGSGRDVLLGPARCYRPGPRVCFLELCCKAAVEALLPVPVCASWSCAVRQRKRLCSWVWAPRPGPPACFPELCCTAAEEALLQGLGSLLQARSPCVRPGAVLYGSGRGFAPVPVCASWSCAVRQR